MKSREFSNQMEFKLSQIRLLQSEIQKQEPNQEGQRDVVVYPERYWLNRGRE